MIYVTGDVHGWMWRFEAEHTPIARELDKDDYFLVAGDFGFVFRLDEEERRNLDTLERLPFTILFIDGNHENFDALNAYPVSWWNGGKVHHIRQNIIHLMRGQVFEIEGKKIFTMGGGYSVDKLLRRKGTSWWREELPSKEEYEEAMENLEKHGFEVDYIITHAAPEGTMNSIFPNHEPEKELNLFLEQVRERTKYIHWYFGHLHMEGSYPNDQTMLYTNGVVLD